MAKNRTIQKEDKYDAALCPFALIKDVRLSFLGGVFCNHDQIIIENKL